MTPAASLWRAFFVWTLVLACGCSAAHGQSTKRYRPQPDYVQITTPDQEEGRKILEKFRGLGIAGDYYLEFDLRLLPRRGEERLHTGQLWGTLVDGAPLTRLVIREGEGKELRYLIRGGAKPRAWRWRTGEASPSLLEGSALMEPILDTFLCPFDLQMPFLQWKDFVFEGIAKLRGRPAHRFLLYPPAELASNFGSMTAVRISLDTQYGALVETELLAAQGLSIKTLSLMELKKVSEQWIIKSLDLRDEVSRSKTRLSFTSGALNCEFSRAVFEPASLGDALEAPQSGVSRF